MGDINPAYDKSVLARAAAHLKREGSVQLQNFLMPDALYAFLNLKWKHVYEPLKYSCHYAKPPALWKMFREILFQLIGRRVKCSVWCIAMVHGDYSVLYDSMKLGKGYAFMLDVNDMPESWGGYTVFMKGEKEMVRVIPKRNALTIVDQSGLKSFHKYVNHHTTHPRIFLYGVALPK